MAENGPVQGRTEVALTPVPVCRKQFDGDCRQAGATRVDT